MNHEGRGVEDRKGLEGHAGDADGERQEGLEDEVIGERAAHMSTSNANAVHLTSEVSDLFI